MGRGKNSNNPKSTPDGAKSTQERLIEAGLDEFGRYGLESATTRRIARAAGVNIALISYYFESKEGLYRAVVAHVVDHIRSHLSATLEEIARAGANSATSARQATALLMKVIGDLIDFMVGSAHAPRFARIILREQLSPSLAYDVIFNHMMQPVIQAIAGMLALAVGSPLTRAVQLRALSLMGQIMAFRVARETVVRLLGMQGYSSAETEQIRRIILEQTEAAVRGLAAEQIEKKSDSDSTRRR